MANAQKIKYEIIGIIYTGFGVFSLSTLLVKNIGFVGEFIKYFLVYGFGIGGYVVSIIFIVIGFKYIITRRPIKYSLRFLAIISLFLFSLSLYHGIFVPEKQELIPINNPATIKNYGGIFSGFIILGMRKLFGLIGANIVLLFLNLIAIISATTWSITDYVIDNKKRLNKIYTNTIDKMHQKREKFTPEKKIKKTQEIFDVEKIKRAEDTKTKQNNIVSISELKGEIKNTDNNKYKLPSLNLLHMPVKIKSTNKDVFNELVKFLEETLASFGVEAKVINIAVGPAVTRYELEPALGVKVSKITNLADDIALNFAVGAVRIEAPIPGKAAIGIEVPNKIITNVSLYDIIDSNEFRMSKSPLTIGLGKDITGNTVTSDLSNMPHLLVAGSTGSGKSVCINSIISSILYKARPNEVKFIMIDPKMVELTNYDGIPHLLVPVVTNAERASNALNWAVKEMNKRYNLFAKAVVRDINRYNQKNEQEKLPFIVIIIDELADLMMVAPVDVENAVCRLAQKARAAGIHLILATQRPSIDIITGTIRNNIPSRIAFSVASQVDSRTILDIGGAEKLLGKGDMLFSPFSSIKPMRVQGVFVSDNELELLIDHVKKQCETEYKEDVKNYI